MTKYNLIMTPMPATQSGSDEVIPPRLQLPSP